MAGTGDEECQAEGERTQIGNRMVKRMLLADGWLQVWTRTGDFNGDGVNGSIKEWKLKGRKAA